MLKIVVDFIEEQRYISNMKKHLKHAPEVGGWVGMGLIHSATIPVTLSSIMGWSSHLPPLSMIAMVWLGLALFFVQE